MRKQKYQQTQNNNKGVVDNINKDTTETSKATTSRHKNEKQKHKQQQQQQ